MSEFRSAALAAEAYLVIDAAQKYGLISGGPTVDVDRCEALIAEAHSLPGSSSPATRVTRPRLASRCYHAQQGAAS